MSTDSIDGRSVVLVHHEYGDWIGVYVDGVLKGQGHSFSPSMLLDLIGVDHERREELFEGSLPEQLADIASVRVTKEDWKRYYG
jgi:hypothetical protein